MSTEHNKRVVQAIFTEIVNQGKVERGNELVAPNYVNYSFPLPVSGPDGMAQVAGMFRAAFPDFQVNVETLVAEGDRVATRGVFSGTHRGAFMGVAASGRRVHTTYADVWRLEQGRAVENWVQMDLLGLLQQLGAAPTPDGD